jgi:hypothetical protein
MDEQLKVCSKCHRALPLTEFYDRKDVKDGKKYWCIDCNRIFSAEYHEDHKAESKEYQRNYARMVRSVALFIYSNGTNKCAICECGEYSKLCIDHPNNDGTAHRKELGIIGGGGVAFANWLKKQGYPDGYRVLCKSCNSKQRRKKETSTSQKTE